MGWRLSLDRPVKAAFWGRDGDESIEMKVSDKGRLVELESRIADSRGYGFKWIDETHGFEFDSSRYFLQVEDVRVFFFFVFCCFVFCFFFFFVFVFFFFVVVFRATGRTGILENRNEKKLYSRERYNNTNESWQFHQVVRNVQLCSSGPVTFNRLA